MSETSPTPLPWAARGQSVESPKPRVRIAFCGSSFTAGVDGSRSISEAEAKANAAFIVHAVNCHAEMVEALREADQLLGETGFALGTGHMRIRSALSKATQTETGQ